MNKRDFPKVHFYDQDFVDVYDKTWTWIQDFWTYLPSGGGEGYFIYPEDNIFIIDQFEAIFSSFFLVYSNRNYPANRNLDYLYAQQEDNGAICNRYDIHTGSPVVSEANPEAVGLPLFAWAEYNLFHKSANKKRVKDVMPILRRYMDWIDATFKRENGLYQVPLAATTMMNAPRDDSGYLIDFNSALAINALYMSALGDILNDKDLSFQYKRLYFSLKTRINSMMWDNETGFYYDIHADGEKQMRKTIAGFWPLLAEIPNEEKAEKLISHLSNEKTFGVEHPFPTLSADDPDFSPSGNGYRGGVFPPFNFIVIKGLEHYQRWDLARECAIRHLYYMLDSMIPPGEGSSGEGQGKGDLWEAYQPVRDGSASWENSGDHGRPDFPRRKYLHNAGLSTITLMIENIIGLSISLPRKTVDWIIPNLEVMGIENLSLKRNMITILSNKSSRGWEIHMESEKLYYFTIHILGQKKKTLPIPSGKCSMLIDKL